LPSQSEDAAARRLKDAGLAVVPVVVLPDAVVSAHEVMTGRRHRLGGGGLRQGPLPSLDSGRAARDTQRMAETAATMAVVTGGAGGIGRALALRLARDGFAIGVLDRDGAGAEATCAAVRQAGGRAAPAPADVTDETQVRRAFATLKEQLGPPTVLVNNAGWDVFGFFRDTAPAVWDKVVAINYRGMLLCTHAALPDLCAAGNRGRVISISSDAGRVGSSGEAVYAGCKAAIIGFSKSLARELARDLVTVNVVCPGPTDTALLAAVGESERGAKVVAGMTRAIPFHRLGQPADVAGAVAFFASPGAGFITGQVLSVSGGLTMAG
jgi:2-hydroxycyclohexanecarboxyl-CoA dehydrogenase